jgi:hypothetical protein
VGCGRAGHTRAAGRRVGGRGGLGRPGGCGLGGESRGDRSVSRVDAVGENCATNTSDTSCHLSTFVISPSTKAGARSGTLFNHYSLLGTTEQLLHLSKLGQAANYPTMVSAFNL